MLHQLRSFVLLLLCMTLCIHTVSALNPEQDRQVWLWFKFTKQLPKKFTVGAQYQLRIGNDVSGFTGQNFYGSVGYRINKYLSSQFTYQFFNSYKTDNHTFFFSLTARYKIKHFTFQYRSAYQRIHEYFNSSYEKGHEPVNEWRNRITIKYSINNDWDVYAFTEPYLNFDPKANAKGLFVNKIRNLIGIDWHFYKYNTVGLFYFLQPELFGKRPSYQHVVGLVYDFDLPKKVKWNKFFHPNKSKKKKEDYNEEEKDNTLF